MQEMVNRNLELEYRVLSSYFLRKKICEKKLFSGKKGEIFGSCKRSCTFRVAYKVQVKKV